MEKLYTIRTIKSILKALDEAKKYFTININLIIGS